MRRYWIVESTAKREHDTIIFARNRPNSRPHRFLDPLVAGAMSALFELSAA